VHVAAVSSGNPTPYPNVNNTERWQLLAASCPYEFTILGRDDVWLGDKGITKNKLMYYAKCVRASGPQVIRYIGLLGGSRARSLAPYVERLVYPSSRVFLRYSFVCIVPEPHHMRPMWAQQRRAGS